MNDPNAGGQTVIATPIPEVEGTHNTGAAAREVAKSIVQGVQEATPTEPTVEEQVGLPYETSIQEPAVEPVPAEGDPLAVAPEVVEQAAEALQEAFEVDSTLLDTLAEMGVELGVEPDSVPEELKSAYGELVQAAVVLADQVIEKDTEAEGLRMQQKELSDQIQQDPTKFLLAMMLTYPDQFKEVIEVAQQVDADESGEVQQRVYRELEAEAKLREANRKEALFSHRERLLKARQLTYLTRQAAKRYGVDPTLAESTVGMQIKAAGGDMDLGAVDNVVKALSGAGGQRRPLRQAVSPAQAAKAKAAPKATPAGEPAPVAAPASGRRTRGPSSPISTIIRDSFRRVVGNE
jgi:hypothetical protein